MPQASSPPTLIGLPVELRLSILDYLIPRDTGNRKTITMSLVEGLRHSGPDNIHIHDVYPSRLSLRRYLNGIGMVNRQLHEDAMVLLYDRTFIVRIGKSQKCMWPQCIADYAMNWTIPMQWQVLLPGLDAARVRELRIQAVSGEDDVTWASIQWRLESFCRILGRHSREQGLKKLVVDIAGMQEYPPERFMWEIGPWGPVFVLDPSKAVFEDVVRLSHAIWLYLSNVRACEIAVPEWASRDQWVLDAIKETKEAIRHSWEEWNELVANGTIDQSTHQYKQREGDEACRFDGMNEQGDFESADAAAEDTDHDNDEREPEQSETEEEANPADPTNDDSESTESDDYPRYNPNDEEEPENTWAKIEGEEWDDFYLLPPPPPYVLEYQLRDSVWIFGEEPQVESSEVDWGW